MLNWDDYGKEEVNTAAAVTATKTVVDAPKVEELKPAPTPVDTEARIKNENTSIEEGSRAKIAREAIKNLELI